MSGASIEMTLELWAHALRDTKARHRLVMSSDTGTEFFPKILDFW